MIIDLILDKKVDPINEPLNARGIKYLIEESKIFGFNEIYFAAYNRNERAIKTALCEYIDKQGYNPDIKEFILKTTWF